uniref:Uncharacterized protein n=1 Tax=Daphnia magna TaxID=35525 RepID=A0A0N8DF49_9CRUS
MKRTHTHTHSETHAAFAMSSCSHRRLFFFQNFCFFFFFFCTGPYVVKRVAVVSFRQKSAHTPTNTLEELCFKTRSSRHTGR